MKWEVIKNGFSEFWKDFTDILYSRVAYTISWLIPGLSVKYVLEKGYLGYQVFTSYILLFFIGVVAGLLQDYVFFKEDKKYCLQIYSSFLLSAVILTIIILITIYGFNIPYPLIFCIYAVLGNITYGIIKKYYKKIIKTGN